MQEFVGGREKLIFSTMTLFQSQFTLTESIGVWPSFTCETKQSDTTIRWAVQTDQFYMHLGFTCKRNREIKDKSRWTQANGPLNMWRIVHNNTINATARCLAAWSLNSFAVVQRFWTTPHALHSKQDGLWNINWEVDARILNISRRTQEWRPHFQDVSL